MTSPRRALPLLSAVGVAVLLSGCAPAPAPAPTPTPVFATEEEAYAAAEQTYRAYTEALNSLRSGDEGADPLDFFTGLALENEIAGGRALAAEGITLTGSTRLVSFAPEEANIQVSPAEMRATVCFDISGVRARDSNMQDITPEARADALRMTVGFIALSAGEVLINESTVSGDRC